MSILRRLPVVFVGLLIWASQSFYIADDLRDHIDFLATEDLGILENI